MSDTLNPFPLMKRAAKGEQSAWRELADWSADRVIADGDLFTTLEALLIARLAAVQGNALDKGRVISLLAIAIGQCGEAQSEFSELCAAEALARISLADEEGLVDGDWVGDALVWLAENASPRVVELSQHFRAALMEAPER